MTLHEWQSWVPIPTDVIRNEDEVFSFKFRFDPGNMDHMVVAHFDERFTVCSKCQGELKDVFGEPCSE